MQPINALLKFPTSNAEKREYDALIGMLHKKINERPRTYKTADGKVKVSKPLSFLAVKHLVRGFSFNMLRDLYKSCREDEMLRQNNWLANKEKSFARRFFIEIKFNAHYIAAIAAFDEKKKEMKTKKPALQQSLFEPITV